MAVSGTGTVIGGRYRLIRTLATGGMGTVWEASDERLQRTVAVKQLQLPPELHGAERAAAIGRAMREARLTARLHHPNAIQVYDLLVDEDGQPSLVMQYVPSTSLHDVVRQRGPLPEADVARIGTQIAAALAAAHRAGIVHRDVKPGNVLIDVDGTAKITDFGISHALDDVTVTTTGMVTGTPAYLAPEIARGAPSDFTSDVYSLGATLYMAVEGRAPFGTDQNAMAILHRVASGHPDPMSRAHALAPIIARMMSIEPGNRPDMVGVANALGTLRIDSPLRAGDDPDATTIIGPADRTMTLPGTPPPELSVPPPVAVPPSAAAPALGPPPLVLPAAALVGPPERQHRPWVPIVAAALVVVVASVLAIVLIADNTGHGSSGGAAAPTGLSLTTPAQRSTSGRPASSSTHGTKPTTAHHPPAHRSRPPHKQRPPHKVPDGTTPPTGHQLARAIRHYYRVVPGDLDTGWRLLTPAYQRSTADGRTAYDRWWHSIARVELSRVRGQSPGSVVATLRYHFKNGHKAVERTRFALVDRNGTLLIDGSRVVG